MGNPGCGSAWIEPSPWVSQPASSCPYLERNESRLITDDQELGHWSSVCQNSRLLSVLRNGSGGCGRRSPASPCGRIVAGVRDAPDRPLGMWPPNFDRGRSVPAVRPPQPRRHASGGRTEVLFLSAAATTRCQSCGALSCAVHLTSIYVPHGQGGAYELRCRRCYSSAITSRIRGEAVCPCRRRSCCDPWPIRWRPSGLTLAPPLIRFGAGRSPRKSNPP